MKREGFIGFGSGAASKSGSGALAAAAMGAAAGGGGGAATAAAAPWRIAAKGDIMSVKSAAALASSEAREYSSILPHQIIRFDKFEKKKSIFLHLISS